LVLGAVSLLCWLINRTAEMLSEKYAERTNDMAGRPTRTSCREHFAQRELI